jgi:hypothetical protein
MKWQHTLLHAVIAASLVSACSDDDDASSSGPGYTVTTYGGCMTKGTNEKDHDFIWYPNDQVNQNIAEFTSDANLKVHKYNHFYHTGSPSKHGTYSTLKTLTDKAQFKALEALDTSGSGWSGALIEANDDVTSGENKYPGGTDGDTTYIESTAQGMCVYAQCAVGEQTTVVLKDMKEGRPAYISCAAPTSGFDVATFTDENGDNGNGEFK